MKENILKTMTILGILTTIFFSFLVIAPPRFNYISRNKEYKNIVYLNKNPYIYFYHYLNDKEKRLYEEFERAISIHQEEFTTKTIMPTFDEIHKAFTAISADHPEFFWVKGFKTSFSIFNTNISLKYDYTTEEAREIDAKMQNKYKRIIDTAKGLNTEEEKIRYVHDNLILIGEYDNDYDNETLLKYQSIATILTTGKTVCAGFTYAFKFIMDELNIPAISIIDMDSLNTDNAHVWNGVYLNDDWYYLDITWDEEAYNEHKDKYKFFLLTKDEFYKSHKPQQNLPN